MTTKEKAQELIQKYTAYAAGDDGDQLYINAKWCALIAVDEIIASRPSTPYHVPYVDTPMVTPEQYWQEVKKELELL